MSRQQPSLLAEPQRIQLGRDGHKTARRRTPLVVWLLLPILAMLMLCVAFTVSAVVLLLTY